MCYLTIDWISFILLLDLMSVETKVYVDVSRVANRLSFVVESPVITLCFRSGLFVRVCVCVCVLARYLKSWEQILIIFKGECLRAGDKSISSWRGSEFFRSSWIIFQEPMPFADRP